MAQGNPYMSEPSNTLNDIRDKASDQIDRMASKAESAARTAYSKSGEVSGNVQEVAGNFKSAVDVSVRDQPMATLAVAAMFGFVLGAIWKA